MKYQAACTLLALVPALAPNPSAASTRPQDPAVVDAEPIELTYYTIKHSNPNELLRIVRDVYGRVLQNGNPARTRKGNSTWNITLFGEKRLLIYETPATTQVILDLLAELDSVSGGLTPAKTPQMVTREYRPRYMSLEDLERSLKPFERSLTRYASSVTAIKSDLLVLRDYAGQVDKMIELLQRIDVPTPQVELTCYILRGSDTSLDEPSGLPKALTENLERLVPFKGLEMLTMGALRISTASKTRGKLEMQVGVFGESDSATFDIKFEVGAFDQEAGALTLELFSARKSSILTPSKSEQDASSSLVRQLFETRTSVTAGEYAVMGATGVEPIFVVLHFGKVAK